MEVGLCGINWAGINQVFEVTGIDESDVANKAKS